MHGKPRLSIAVWALVVCLVSGACRGGSASSSSSGPIDEPSAEVDLASGFSSATFAPGLEYTFSTFEEIEKTVGYRVLRTDSTFRREFFNRFLTEGSSGWRYYEAYTAPSGPDQITVTSVLQYPTRDGAPGGWEKRTWSGWEVSLKHRVREVEARFFTGRMDASGVPIQATVIGQGESSVQDLISSLNFHYGTQ